MAVIGVDFDKTIMDDTHVLPGYKMGPPMEGAVEALRELSRTNTIIIFSARAATADGRKSIEDWMRYFSAPYQSMTAIKPAAAIVFVDDRGYRFRSWDQTLRDLPRVVSENQAARQKSNPEVHPAHLGR